MPAISSYDAPAYLESRDWRQTVGQSGMTPTAFAFLIPVFVVVVFAPFLCVFCIRKRGRGVVAPIKPAKKPALRRAEARERLKQVTDVANVTDAEKAPARQAGVAEESEGAQSSTGGESASMAERECAICLSTLHAPSPPEPALLASTSTVDEAAIRPPTATPDSNTTTDTPADPEAILKLQVCGHEFHSECLVSWFVLRKTTCPICRAAYMSKEDMKAYEDEDAAVAAEANTAATPEVLAAGGARTDANGVRISNWQYFWGGESVWNRHRNQGQGSAPVATVDAAERGEGSGNANATANAAQMRQVEAVEMASWTYLARTRR